jgi:uncharacterized protein (DUF1684 family)
MDEYLELTDYRQRVAAIYARVRAAQNDPEAAWREFRRMRDELFRDHPQSALMPDHRGHFKGLTYYPYDSRLRFVVPYVPIEDGSILDIHLREDGLMRLRRAWTIHFEIENQAAQLTVFWMLGYGGGIFLPFADASNRDATYGGGRYLLDTIKGADLGHEGGNLIIDFNYAYNPSCVYNPRWDCPLAPPENRLSMAIRAGEKRFNMELL